MGCVSLKYFRFQLSFVRISEIVDNGIIEMVNVLLLRPCILPPGMSFIHMSLAAIIFWS
jgi:hypothetical protein